MPDLPQVCHFTCARHRDGLPYDLTLSDGSRHELYGPWRVDAAAGLVDARRRAGRPLHVAATAPPCRDPYGVRIDPGAVVAVADPLPVRDDRCLASGSSGWQSLLVSFDGAIDGGSGDAEQVAEFGGAVCPCPMQSDQVRFLAG